MRPRPTCAPSTRLSQDSTMPFDGIKALFYPTPQEHLNGMWKIIKKLPPSPPPRCVGVDVPFLYTHSPSPSHPHAETDTSACTSTSGGTQAAMKPNSSCATARSWPTFRSTDPVVSRSPGSRLNGRFGVVRWVPVLVVFSLRVSGLVFDVRAPGWGGDVADRPVSSKQV